VAGKKERPEVAGDRNMVPNGADPPCWGPPEDSGGVVDSGSGGNPPWVIAGGVAGSGRSGLPPADPAFRLDYPVFWEWLTATSVCGRPRKTGTFLLFAEEGRLKAALNDREGLVVAFASSDTFLGLLETVNEGLQTGRLDWRPGKRR